MTDLGHEVVELVFPPDVEYLAMVRLLVGAAASTVPMFPLDRLDDLRLAVSEACTNAIDAQQASDDRITLRCLLAADTLTVEVSDSGPGFDPTSLRAHPPVTDPSRLQYERGLGIPLIRILTDEVEFESDNKGTTVRMVLNLLPPTLRDS